MDVPCPLPALQPIWPRVGAWTVLRPLGQGGMGMVYAAHGGGHAGTVALKIVDPGRTASVRARLLAEARAAAAVRHPNLVRCLDVGEACEVPYLVMEIITGPCADELLGGAPVPEPTLRALAADIAAGLGALHAAGVCHRDLKPGNILRHPDGRWLLADFGLAHLGDGQRLTRAGHVVGTPEYMAPEQTEAGGEPGPPADLYSLGATLYQLATGGLPHPGANAWEVMNACVHQPFPDPLAARPDLSPTFAAVIRKLGAKDLDERYADARQVADDLALIAAGRPPVHARFRNRAALLGTAANVPAVLVIDDDPLVRALYGAVLRKRGWRVELAADGAHGLDAAWAADVAVIDLMLPDTDGLDIVTRLRRSHPHLPLVVLTNAFNPHLLAACRQTGAAAVLDKAATTPTGLADIIAALVAHPPLATGDGSATRLLASADAALARAQVQAQGLTEPATCVEACAGISATARGLALAAGESGRVAAARLATVVEELARHLHAHPARRTPAALDCLRRAVDAVRPLMLGSERAVFHGRAVVVDDEPASLLLAHRALEKVGIAATAVSTPQAALEQLRAQPCDLLLTDVVMDGGSGFQLAHQARRLPGCAHLPVVFVTSLSDFPQFFIANLAGGSDLQCKPYLLSELGARAMILLAARPPAEVPGADAT
jgi:CheY-like chemotaxis protein